MSSTKAASDALLTLLRDAFADEKGLRVLAVPGQILITDWAWFGCPVIFVRLDSAFPSAQFPNPAAVSGPCGNPYVARFHVGASRCVAGLDENGNAPSPERQTADANQIMDDADKLRRVLCEAAADRTHFDPRGTALGVWTPMGPLGNVAGGWWPFTARLLR